ncbi:MAG: hypothetical protein M3301_06205 [Chloroflexota bacterium]|nr:hypothetical protein [Chloroflexota bacterium]
MALRVAKKKRISRRAAFGVAAVILMLSAVSALGVAWWNPGHQGPVVVATTSASTFHSTDAAGSQTKSRALPLRGDGLRGRTGLRVLVADVPGPFVLDVDRGTVESVKGLPGGGHRGVSVQAVGKDALVFSYRVCGRCRPDPRLYVVRHGTLAAVRLAGTAEAVPSLDGEGLWVLTRRYARQCAIRKIDLDGRLLHAPRQVRCGTGLVAELPAGLFVSYSGPLGSDSHHELLEPDGRVVRLPYQEAQPVVGNLVLTGADRRTPLLLHDIRTRARSRLRWPSTPDYGLSEVTGEPNGPLAIVEFAKYSPVHKVDLWLLNTRTRRWQHLPAMPARLIPKITDVKWTTDGRVVILSGDLLALWRPGEPRLAVARVKPSKQPGTGFVIW